MTDNDSPKPTPKSISGKGVLPPITGTATLTVIPADRVEVENSPTLKYLRLRNGDIKVPNRVFIVSECKRREITMDSLPDEEQGA